MLHASWPLAVSPAVETHTALIYLNYSSMSSIRDRRGERILWYSINLEWAHQQKERRQEALKRESMEWMVKDESESNTGKEEREERQKQSYTSEVSLPSKLH